MSPESLDVSFNRNGAAADPSVTTDAVTPARAEFTLLMSWSSVSVPVSATATRNEPSMELPVPVAAAVPVRCSPRATAPFSSLMVIF